MGSREKMTGFAARQAALETVRTGAGVCWRRIGQLLDADSFVELDSMVEARGLTFGPERSKVAGDGVVTGYGTLDGRLIYVAAQDPSVHGGSIGRMHALKIAKAVQLACAAQVPFIGLYDTGGSRIEEGIQALEGLGALLAALDDASGQIPLVAAVFGPCAGGAAFAAASSDFVLMGGQKSGIYMNGPMVVSAVEGKTIEPADIGGPAVHAGKTGLAMLTASDETDLVSRIKYLMQYVPDSADGFMQMTESADDPNRTEARLDEIAAALDDGYDMREVIGLVFDQGSFLELSPEYASGQITGLARLAGVTVGVLAQTGNRVDSRMARKASRLAALCERLNLPLISLVDSEGYALGLADEQGGLVQDGASLMQTMLRLTVPRLSVLVGKAIGTAYLTFGSKGCGADLVYAWPTAEVAAVTPDTAAQIVYRKEIAASADPAATRAERVRYYAAEVAAPAVAASLGHVDEVILPSATRPRLVSALDMLTSVC